MNIRWHDMPARNAHGFCCIEETQSEFIVMMC
jgi:hypothetical protein